MVDHAIRPCFIGLINVHALHGPAKSLYTGLAVVVGLATDCVVENEDFRGTGAVHSLSIKIRISTTRVGWRVTTES